MPSRQPHATPPISSSVSLTSSFRKHEFLILCFAIGGAIAALFVFMLLFFILYRRLRARNEGTQYLRSVKLHKFRYRELKAATGSFSSENKLGQGGFGAVYKGILRNGQEIAVKKLDSTSLQGEREFRNEVCVIGELNSPHIVGLLGFCADGEMRLLVYEYMHNRSVQEALFDYEYPVNLDWDRRFKIILDTAKALAFLHTKCDPPIIHGDIKPSNILLDCKFSARIGDFGLARLKAEDNGPDLRSEQVEGQFQEREYIKRQRRSVEEEKSKRKREGTTMSKNAAKESQSQAGGLHDNSCKESPNDSWTSPIGEDPCGLISIDQESGIHEQFKHLNNVREPATLFDKASTRESPLEPDDSEDEKLSARTLEAEVKCANASSASPDGLEKESEKFTKGDHCEQRSTEMLGEGLEVEAKAQPEGCLDKSNGKELHFEGEKSKEKKRGSFGRDWWWRQESTGEFSVKEYVMEWMGHEGRRDESKSKDWSLKEGQSGEDAISQDNPKPSEGWKERRRDQSRSSEWWGWIFNEEEAQSKKEKSQDRGKKWWKEEPDAELKHKNKELHSEQTKNKEMKKQVLGDSKSGRSASLEWWRNDIGEENSNKRKKNGKKKKHKGERKEWWNEEELDNNKEGKERKKKREKSLSRDWWSGDILSRGACSTPSMRGTICYVAPEYGGGGFLSEKSDVYSFGVLLLVIVSGRRPLQVMDSPLAEFQRGNLISWARHLAQFGNLLDLVDNAMQGEYCRQEASLCLNVALMCLQRLPAVRPSMDEVVKILSGEVEVPCLPFAFSPSPPSGIPLKSRRHTLSSEGVAINFPLLA